MQSSQVFLYIYRKQIKKNVLTKKGCLYFVQTTTGKSRRELSEVHGFSEEQIAGKNELFIIKIFYKLFFSILVFEESFSLLDKDGDGNITTYEIRSLMNSLGYSPSEEDISTVISKVDTNGKLFFKENLNN